MDLLIPAIVILASLVIHTGVTRPFAFAHRAHGSGPAAHTATADQPIQAAAQPAVSADPNVTHLVWASMDASPGAVPFPTLSAIDSACAPGRSPFATDPRAAMLERRARALTDRYWSETVWLTGLIDQARFETVYTELDRERKTRLDSIDIIVVPESSRVPG